MQCRGEFRDPEVAAPPELLKHGNRDSPCRGINRWHNCSADRLGDCAATTRLRQQPSGDFRGRVGPRSRQQSKICVKPKSPPAAPPLSPGHRQSIQRNVVLRRRTDLILMEDQNTYALPLEETRTNDLNSKLRRTPRSRGCRATRKIETRKPQSPQRGDYSSARLFCETLGRLRGNDPHAAATVWRKGGGGRFGPRKNQQIKNCNDTRTFTSPSHRRSNEQNLPSVVRPSW